MAKSSGSISIGRGPGAPRTTPEGPYTTAEHDDERAAPGQDLTRTRPGGSRTETRIARESELASDRAGDEAARKPADGAQEPNLPRDPARRPKGPAQP